MANAAALAVLATALFVGGIVLMSTSYTQTGVFVFALGFLSGVAHAIERSRESKTSEGKSMNADVIEQARARQENKGTPLGKPYVFSRIPENMEPDAQPASDGAQVPVENQSEPPARPVRMNSSGNPVPKQERNTMHDATRESTSSKGSFTRFLGVLISLVAMLIAAAVVTYFYYVFWLGQAPDFKITAGGSEIPPEAYPIILLSIWTISQRAMSNWRPAGGVLGTCFWWADIITSVVVAGFLGFTFFKAIVTGTNLTFLIVLAAFVMQAAADIVLNGRHLYNNGFVGGAPGATVLTIGDIRDGVMIVPTYHGKYARVEYDDIQPS